MGWGRGEWRKKKPLIGAFVFDGSNPFADLRWVVPGAGLEPARCLAPADFESAASTNFATPAAIEAQIMAQCSVVFGHSPSAHAQYAPEWMFFQMR